MIINGLSLEYSKIFNITTPAFMYHDLKAYSVSFIFHLGQTSMNLK